MFILSLSLYFFPVVTISARLSAYATHLTPFGVPSRVAEVQFTFKNQFLSEQNNKYVRAKNSVLCSQLCSPAII